MSALSKELQDWVLEQSKFLKNHDAGQAFDAASLLFDLTHCDWKLAQKGIDRGGQ